MGIIGKRIRYRKTEGSTEGRVVDKVLLRNPFAKFAEHHYLVQDIESDKLVVVQVCCVKEVICESNCFDD